MESRQSHLKIARGMVGIMKFQFGREGKLQWLWCRSLLYVSVIFHLPQTTVVRANAKLHIVSNVVGRIGLIVIGSSKCSFCEDWPGGPQPFECRRQTTEPLLPGESILLFVGMGSPALAGKALFDTSLE